MSTNDIINDIMNIDSQIDAVIRKLAEASKAFDAFLQKGASDSGKLPLISDLKKAQKTIEELLGAIDKLKGKASSTKENMYIEVLIEKSEVAKKQIESLTASLDKYNKEVSKTNTESGGQKEKSKAAKEEAKTVEDAAKAAKEKAKAAKEESKATEEDTRKTKENTKATEENTRAKKENARSRKTKKEADIPGGQAEQPRDEPKPPPEAEPNWSTGRVDSEFTNKRILFEQQPLSGIYVGKFKENLSRLLPEALRTETALSNIVQEVSKVNSLFPNPPSVGEFKGIKVLDSEKGIYKLKLAFEDAAGAAWEFNEAINTQGKVVEFNKSKIEGLTAEQQRLYAENQKYAKAFDQASRIDPRFTPSTLRRVVSRNEGATESLEFKFEDELGRIRQLDLTVDRFGNTVVETSRRFRTFTQGVVRDVRELTKWTIAVGLIYGPLRQMQTLFDEMVQNESKLADATIAVNTQFASSAQIFNAAAVAARNSGEAIGGVLDAFTMAYRASGAGGDSVRRFAIANKLLADSLVLSKLSTLSQADAIDTLSASLKQSSMGLDEGVVLLDKWVQVTKVANVDLTTLATGFAVLGDTAGNVGLSLDELNGLIAVVAESGIASGREAANIARRLVGTYSTDSAIAELNKYGIAVVDVTGKTRTFAEVVTELSNLQKSGVLTADELNNITYALGQGPRGQASWSALITNWERVGQIAKSSSEAVGSGVAYDALATKLETTQTALERLNNSFQELAQTAGTKGGFLDVFKTLIEMLDNSVRLLEKLTGAVGKTSLALAALAAVGLFAKDEFFSEAGRVSMFGPLFRKMGLKEIEDGSTGMLSALGNRKTFYGGSTGSNYVKLSNLIGSVGGSLLGVGIPAVANLTNKNYEEAGANIAGGFLGFMISGGNPIGAIIGSAAGEALVRTFFTYETQFVNFFEDVGFKKTGEKPLEETEIEQLQRKAFESSAVNAFGPFGAFLGKPMAQLTSMVYNYGSRPLGQLFGYESEEITPERIAYLAASPKIKAEMDRRYKLQAAATGGAGSIVSERQDEIRKRDSELLTRMLEEKRNELFAKLSRGEITPSKYGQIFENLSGFESQSTRFLAAFGDELKGLSPEIENIADAYKMFLELGSEGSSETLKQIVAMSSEIDKLSTQLETFPKDALTIKVGGVDKTREQIERELEQLKKAAAQLSVSAYQDLRISKLNLPRMVGGYEGYKEEDALTIYNKAVEIQANYLREAGLTESDIAEYRKGLDKFVVLIEKAGEKTYKTFDQLDTQFWGIAESMEKAAGKIASVNVYPNLQEYNITGAEYDVLRSGYYTKLAEIFKERGYSVNEENTVALLTDSFRADRIDNKIMQILLQQILETEKKQLDGMYNIPEGATFWVPIQAAYYGRSGPGGGGGGGIDYSKLDKLLDWLQNNLKPPEQVESSVIENKNIKNAPAQLSEDWVKKFEEDLAKQTALGQYTKIEKQIKKPPRPQTQPEEEPDKKGINQKQLLELALNAYSLIITTTISKSISGAIGQALQLVIPKIINEMLQNIPMPGIYNNKTNLQTSGDVLANKTRTTENIIQNANKLGRGTETAVQTSRVDLRITSNTTLNVDGRVLAYVVKTYLANDMLRTLGNYGATTRSVVI